MEVWWLEKYSKWHWTSLCTLACSVLLASWNSFTVTMDYFLDAKVTQKNSNPILDTVCPWGSYPIPFMLSSTELIKNSSKFFFDNSYFLWKIVRATMRGGTRKHELYQGWRPQRGLYRAVWKGCVSYHPCMYTKTGIVLQVNLSNRYGKTILPCTLRSTL